MKFYTYCVAEDLTGFEGSLVGIAEREVEFLTIDDLIVVASKFDDEVVRVTRENVLRHESVVRGIFSATTPLPFRFGTLATSATLHNYLRARHDDLIKRLGAVRNCVEMSIKIIWRNWSEQQYQTDSENPVPSNESGVGASFLISKRRELLGDEKLTEEAREIAAWLSTRLEEVVREEQVSVRPKEKMVFAGAYLVERSLESKYRTELTKLKAERPNLHFLTSGPWPPYTFANIDLEFQTHFGVS
jgi:Gas vesicle synthesis protein GvpL/GvpF